jgi:hypothetical protein
MKTSWQRLCGLVAVLVVLTATNEAWTQRFIPTRPPPSFPTVPAPLPPLPAPLPSLPTITPAFPTPAYVPLTPALPAVTPSFPAATPTYPGGTPSYSGARPSYSRPSRSYEETRRRERAAIRNDFWRQVSSSPVAALRVLRDRGWKLDSSDRQSLARSAVSSLRSRVISADSAWALGEVQAAERLYYGEATASLRDLLREVETRCLHRVVGDLSPMLSNGEWGKARQLIEDRLGRLASVQSALPGLRKIIALGQQAAGMPPWAALTRIKETQRAENAAFSPLFASLQPAVEARCLIEATSELQGHLRTRQWDQALRLIEKLKDLSSQGDAAHALRQAVEIGREADRLDRLRQALKGSGPEEAEAWKRVPVEQLPAPLQSRAAGLRSVAVLREALSRSPGPGPNPADLMQALIDFRSGQWNNAPSQADRLQLKLGTRALDEGQGTLAYLLLQDLGPKLPRDQAGDMLRNMEKHALEGREPGKGGPAPRAPPVSGIASLIPAGQAQDYHPAAQGGSYAPELKVAEKEVPGMRETLKLRLSGQSRAVREKLAAIRQPQARRLIDSVFQRAAAGGSGGAGPDQPILIPPVPVNDDDERKKLLAALETSLKNKLSIKQKSLVLRMHRQGETAGDILRTLKAKEKTDSWTSR